MSFDNNNMGNNPQPTDEFSRTPKDEQLVKPQGEQFVKPQSVVRPQIINDTNYVAMPNNESQHENSSFAEEKPPYAHQYMSYSEQVRPKKRKGKTILAGLAILLAIGISGVGSSAITAYMLLDNQQISQTSTQTNNQSASSSVSTENVVSFDGPTIDIINNGSSDTTVPMSDSSNPVTLTVPQIYAKASASVVGIQTQSIYYGYSSTGTGIIMSEDGYVITNNHVIADGDIITVVLESGSQYTAEIIGCDSETDLAVLKFTPSESEPLTVAEFGNSDALVVGDLAIAIGNPGGLDLQGSLSGGYISAVEREIVVEDVTMTLIQTDASINPGNSGGPLLNEYGQVIGINTIKIGDVDYEGLGFAIPINSAKEIIEELIMYGYIAGRPSIGVTGYSITEEIAAYNNVPQGLLVKSVDIRSDAYAQGLKENDIIYGVNGIITPTIDDINAVKDEYKAGDKITLNVFRANTNIEIVITLMDEVDLETTTSESTTTQDSYVDPYSQYTDPYSQYTDPYSQYTDPYSQYPYSQYGN